MIGVRLMCPCCRSNRYTKTGRAWTAVRLQDENGTSYNVLCGCPPFKNRRLVVRVITFFCSFRGTCCDVLCGFAPRIQIDRSVVVRVFCFLPYALQRPLFVPLLNTIQSVVVRVR